jgi:hypothetical protein
MKVTEHLIRAPAADQADNVGVDVGKEKGHGTTSAKGLGVDISRKEANAGTEGGNGEAEGLGDVGGGNGMVRGASARLAVVGGQRSGCGSIVSTKVEDTIDGGDDRAGVGVAAAAQANDFATHPILLIGEGVEGEGGGKEVGVGVKEEIQTAKANKQLNVFEGKRCSVGRGAGVLTRAHEEEESDSNHVTNGEVVDSPDGGGSGEDVEDDRDRDGLDAVGWGIGAGVATELAFEAKIDGAYGVEARVWGPQSGEALAHRTEGVLHCARANWLAAGSGATVAVALGEDLENEDWVWDVGKVFIGAEGKTEGAPAEPCFAVGSGA